ncbi:MAG: tRNA (guanosine(46)-N7)-methyltransferase TrmB [Calditrichia bacterium]
MKTAEYLNSEINPRNFSKYPINWLSVFGREAQLFLEIGCGNGEFLAAWAQDSQDGNFIGIELSLESAERIQRRIHENRLGNVMVLRDDARFLVRELFPDDSLHHVMMNFPDPWPKLKHRERRVIIPGFVDSLAAVLEPDGIFELVTDQEWYAKESGKLFARSGFFGVREIERNPVRRITTRYERKWREENRDIFRLVAERKNRAQIQRIVENDTMPHVIVEKDIQPGQLYSLKGLVKKEENRIFLVKEVFSNQNNEAYVLRTVATDQDYTQNFFILVAKHEKGYIIKIDPAYQPYRTPAVKMAVRELGVILGSE